MVLLACLGATQGPAHWGDAAAGAAACCVWSVQEYVVHRYLLHGGVEWGGKEIHHGHHNKEYFHVSIDGPGIVLGAMVASALLLAASPLDPDIATTSTLVRALAWLGFSQNRSSPCKP